MNITLATEYMISKHAGQKRMGGEDYATHPIAVAKLITTKNFGEDMEIAALFHDLLEDTDATEQDILLHSNQAVLDAVKLLTKYKGYNMDDYLKGIAANPIALMVKLADRVHNLQSATVATPKFKEKYITETKQHYLPLSQGTPFQQEMETAYMNLVADYKKCN